jgi:hypothetical protein
MGSDLEKHLSRKSTKKQKLQQEVYPVTNLDDNLVGWDSQTDSTNPRNFPQNKKWFILGLISAITFLVTLASSVIAPGISFVNEEFTNTSQLLGAFAVSVFLAGFAVSIFEAKWSECVLTWNRSDHFSLVSISTVQLRFNVRDGSTWDASIASETSLLSVYPFRPSI